MQNHNQVRMLARITARSEKIDELRCVLLQLREETRKENRLRPRPAFSKQGQSSGLPLKSGKRFGY
jgi:hypothetical protein